MTIAFGPTGLQLATLSYPWYEPFNQTVYGNIDTTTLAVQFFGPINYWPPYVVISNVAVVATAGTIKAQGQVARLSVGLALKANSGSVKAQGRLARLTIGANLQAKSGSVKVQGRAARLTIGANLQAKSGSVKVQGQVARVIADVVLRALPGTIAAIGHPAVLAMARNFVAQSGVATVTGYPAQVKFDLSPFIAESGAVELRGYTPSVTAAAPFVYIAHTGAVSITSSAPSLTMDVVQVANSGMIVAAGSLPLLIIRAQPAQTIDVDATSRHLRIPYATRHLAVDADRRCIKVA